MTLAAADAPSIDGINWTVDQPFTNKRYTFETDELVFVIRDLGCSSLWRLHVKTKATGEVRTYGRDDNGNNQDGIDGLRTLYGAAFRLAMGRVRDQGLDPWKTEAFPTLYGTLFAGISS